LSIDLVSPRARLRRAHEHVTGLMSAVARWQANDPYRSERRASEDFRRHSIVCRWNTAPDLTAWSLMASDALHSLRSALDQLVYAVAVHQCGQKPPPNERTLAFPITDDNTLFAGAAWRIKSLSAAVQQEIESAQPFNRPHARLPPLLGLLRDLDDANKHRTLQVVLQSVAAVDVRQLSYGVPPGHSLSIHYYTGPVIDGSELVALELPEPVRDLSFGARIKIVAVLPHKPGPPPERNDRSALSALFSDLLVEVTGVVGRISDKA